MSRTLPAFLIIIAIAAPAYCEAPPFAPASVSWLPHGYGQTMWVDNTPCVNFKGLHGFRTSPEHVGSWSYPLWGWDVNGFYRGPQVPEIDPVDCQLPIGLIYPENNIRLGLPLDGPGSRVRK
jgi:hypothetical protein